MTLATIILAAGKGTRMQSKRPKIMHEAGGKPMILHLFESAEKLSALPPVIVVGPNENSVQQLIGNRAQYVVQEEALGTGHATLMAQSLLADKADQIIVTYADMPLLRQETMFKLADVQRRIGASVVMMSVMGDPSSTFGRVVRGYHGYVTEICEVAEAIRRPNGEAYLAIRELNAGVYCFQSSFLWNNLPNLPLRQARVTSEYYLTDLIEIAAKQGKIVEAIAIDDPQECLGAGTRAELVEVEAAFRQRTIRKWLGNGVTIINPAQTYIDTEVEIGQDTIIWPGSYLQGKTVIGADCVIGPNVIIRSSQIGARCVIEQAVIENCVLPDETHIPAFSNLKGITM